MISFKGFSQESPHQSITLLSKTGFLWAHRSHMEHLVKGLNTGLELEFSQQRQPYNFYTEKMKWPVQGFSLTYQDFGNPSVLGKGFGLIQFTKFNLIQHPKFGFLDLRLGSGFSIITKKYDPIENPKNNAIGSYLNHFIVFHLSYEKHFEHFNLGLGLELNHFSSASMQQPNLGLNTPMLCVRTGFNTSKRKVFEPFDGSVIAVMPRNPKHLQIDVLTTVKQNAPGNHPSKMEPVIGLKGSYIKYLNLSWDLEGNIDVIYNQANRFLYDDKAYSFLQATQLGIAVSGVYNFYKSQIYFGLGLYVFDHIKAGGPVYNRVGYRYKIKDNWRVYCGIKAHYGKADYMEAGIGYAF